MYTYTKSSGLGEYHYDLRYYPSMGCGIIEIKCEREGMSFGAKLDVEQMGSEVIIDVKPLEHEASKHGYNVAEEVDALRKLISSDIQSISAKDDGYLSVWQREIREGKTLYGNRMG